MSSPVVEPVETHDRISRAADELVARGVACSRDAQHPVNQATIDHWLEAMGDTNPRWRRGEAPWAMAQVWTMYALGAERDPDDPLHTMINVLTDEGFTGVLGTNSEQTYHRTLRVGERPRLEMRLESVVGPKQTGMGTGYFVTSRSDWYVGDELVAEMLFRVLKFVPKVSTSSATGSPDGKAAGEGADLAGVLRPVVNRDTAYFWEGTQAGELRLQTCNACGELRHPPGPVCPSCHAMDRSYVVASGRGTVFSHLTHHAPRLPGYDVPVVIALVELEESRDARSPLRLVAQVDESVEIGEEVVVGFRRVDDDLTLPVWRKP